MLHVSLVRLEIAGCEHLVSQAVKMRELEHTQDGLEIRTGAEI